MKRNGKTGTRTRHNLHSVGDVPLVILILLLALSACGTGESFNRETGPASAQPTSKLGTMPPAVVITIQVPENNQSFELINSEDLSGTATRNASVADEANEMTMGAPPILTTVTVVPTPSVTPLPTFTPPALPETPPWEHFWLRRPVPEGGIVWTDKSYPYGSTKGGTLRPHHGVEFNVPAGTPILAAASGTVVFAGNDSVDGFTRNISDTLAAGLEADEGPLGADFDFYGNVVVVELDTRLDGKPVYNLYGHLSELFVVEGQHVLAEEPIALSGASGVADGPHMHFEVRLGSNRYDSTRNPLLWLYPFPDRGVVAGRISRPNGALAQNVPVSLRRIDAPSPYAATTTYGGEGVNSDDMWNENFALDDVMAGFYELTIGTGKEKISLEMWVHPYQTTFVEVVLDK